MSGRTGWRWILGLGILVGVAGCVAAMAWGWIFKEDARNFHVVTPGVLYRSAELEPEDLAETVRRYQVKTIVNLREDTKFVARGLSEKTWAESQGLRYVYLPAESETEEGRLHRFLEVVSKPESQPALVHCHQGQTCTGLAVAAYRVCVEGWSAKDAAAEMVKYGARGSFAERSLPLLQKLKDTDGAKFSRAQPAGR